MTTPAADCSAFIPDGWREAVPGAPLPASDDVRAWQGFGVAQTGQLTKANGRLADTLHIVGECERRANTARPRRRVLGIF